jgi:hypothetical protein
MIRWNITPGSCWRSSGAAVGWIAPGSVVNQRTYALPVSQEEARHRHEVLQTLEPHGSVSYGFASGRVLT